MNAADGTIDVSDFERPTVVAVMRYLYAGDVDVQHLISPQVCRFAARYFHLF